MHQNLLFVAIGIATTLLAASIVQALVLGAMGAAGAWIAKKLLDYLLKIIKQKFKKIKNGYSKRNMG